MSELRGDDAASSGSRAPGRPRDPGVEKRILDAAIDEYLARGSAKFTIDGVARRARVGKSTVYLRWPDRDSLLMDSIMARSRGIEDVDTGTLRGDLVELTSNLMRFLLDPVGFATLQITVDAVANPAYHQVAAQIAQLHRAAIQGVVDRAHARNEIPLGERAAENVDLAIECLFGAVVMKILVRGFEPPSQTEEEIRRTVASTVDVVLPMLQRDA